MVVAGVEVRPSAVGPISKHGNRAHTPDLISQIIMPPLISKERQMARQGILLAPRLVIDRGNLACVFVGRDGAN